MVFETNIFDIRKHRQL